MLKLSTIILSYNTRSMTEKTIRSLLSSLKDAHFLYEVIVVDNGSSDGSVEMIQSLAKNYKVVRLISNKKNLGFPKGNNMGLKVAQGEYILFLNSDVTIKNISYETLFTYFENNPKVGVMTVRVSLPSGEIDPASHRGFPTVWNSFCYFSKLELVLDGVPLLNTIFGGYHQTQKNLSDIHEIDSPTGAFYFMKASLAKTLKGFDERFFMYGEDLDLSFRVKQHGFKVIYYPFFEVVHYKGLSGFQTKTPELRTKTRGYFYDAMKLFFSIHYARLYPHWFNSIVYFFIDLKMKIS